MKTPGQVRWRNGGWIAALALAALAQALGAGEPAGRHRKFIELGWDIPSTTLLCAGWREMESSTPFGVVTVPSDVGKLVILLNLTGQVEDADACWFDNLALYRLR